VRWVPEDASVSGLSSYPARIARELQRREGATA